MPATKQQIRQMIADNNFNSVADVYSLLKDSFKDILSITVDATLQELGSGTQPANRPVWRTAHTIPVKRKTGTSHLIPKNVPALFHWH